MVNVAAVVTGTAVVTSFLVTGQLVTATSVLTGEVVVTAESVVLELPCSCSGNFIKKSVDVSLEL